MHFANACSMANRRGRRWHGLHGGGAKLGGGRWRGLPAVTVRWRVAAGAEPTSGRVGEAGSETQ